MEKPSNSQSGIKLSISKLIPHPTNERAKINNKLSSQFLYLVLKSFTIICYSSFNPIGMKYDITHYITFRYVRKIADAGGIGQLPGQSGHPCEVVQGVARGWPSVYLSLLQSKYLLPHCTFCTKVLPLSVTSVLRPSQLYRSF